MKGNTKKLFEGEVLEKLNRGSILLINKYSKYDTLKLIASKNKPFLKGGSQKQLVSSQNYGNPLNQWVCCTKQ